MDALKNIKTSIQNLKKPDTIKLKGIIKDFFPESRELKADLLKAVDESLIIADPVNIKTALDNLSDVRVKIRLITPDHSRQQELYNICMYLNGRNRLHLSGAYNSRIIPASDNKPDVIKEKLTQIYKRVNSEIDKARKTPKSGESYWPLITLSSILALILTTIIVIYSWKPSVRGTPAPSYNSVESIDMSVRASYSVEGNYIGVIESIGDTSKYALMVREYSGDTLVATLIDYPFYNSAKISFFLKAREDNVFISEYGDLRLSSDSLVSVEKGIEKSEQTLLFERR